MDGEGDGIVDELAAGENEGEADNEAEGDGVEYEDNCGGGDNEGDEDEDGFGRGVRGRAKEGEFDIEEGGNCRDIVGEEELVAGIGDFEATGEGDGSLDWGPDVEGDGVASSDADGAGEELVDGERDFEADGIGEELLEGVRDGDAVGVGDFELNSLINSPTNGTLSLMASMNAGGRGTFCGNGESVKDEFESSAPRLNPNSNAGGCAEF
ncbi:Cardiolipin synthetase [Gracilaria domingensis]|nr:Cardiolipin synthetase [Gracilaria domingensis]